MTPTPLRAVLVVATLVALAAPAFAQDAAEKEKAPAAPAAPAVPVAPAAAAKPSFPDAQAGDRIRVKLRGGRSVDGVVVAKGMWEKREYTGSWSAGKRDERNVGVRLWWVNDLDGFMFVPQGDILELRVLQSLTEEELADLAKKRKEAAQKAAAERERLEQERARAEDASNRARLLLEEVEKARQETSAAVLVDQDRKDLAVKAKRWGELLGRFPPEKWTPDTPKEIERRKTVLHLFPNDDEREFLKVFDEYRDAWNAWKSAQDKAAEKAASRK